MLMDYETWYDAAGFQIAEEIDEWMNECPYELSDERTEQLIYDILENQYGVYISDAEDREYEHDIDDLLS
jgi:dsDNA-binding SOS-regulon protein